MPWVHANGIRIYYEIKGSGEPLLLLMGLGADHSVWEDHVKVYEQHFQCILMDNRGAGRTDSPPGPYSTATMAEDALGLLDALGIESTHVAGISMGSAIAQEMALQRPATVRSLTLNCPWSRCDVYTTRIFEIFRSTIATAEPPIFTHLLQWVIFTPNYHENHLDNLQKREQAAANYAFPMKIHAFQAQCDACMSHDTRGRLNTIKVPTFITVGDHDRFTPLYFAQDIASEIPGSELLVFEGSGHTHHWDQLDKFNQATLQFLLRQEKGA